MENQSGKLVFITLEWQEDHCWEIHAQGCKDIRKKIGEAFTIDSLEVAKAIIEENNADYIAESGGDPAAGYYIDQHAKIYPCVKKVGA